MTQYVHANWSIEEGLPQSTVYAVVQDLDGYIWAATQEGFVRFDGLRFVVFDKASLEQLTSNYALALLACADGSILVGTDGGLVQINNGQLRVFTTTDGLLSNSVTALLQSNDGSIWIGTDEGINRLANGRISVLEFSRRLPHPTVTALAEDWSGNLWIGTMDGLVSVDSHQLSLQVSDGFPKRHILALSIGHDGSLWIGTNGEGLYRHRSGRFRVYGEDEGLSSKRVSAIYEDREGTVWIGTLDQGFGRLRDERLEFFAGEPAIAGMAVSSFLQDREGNLWLGTASGLHRLAEPKVISFARTEGLVDDDVKTIHGDRDGTLWVGTKRGIQPLGGQGEFQKPVSSLRATTSWSSRDGSLWLGTIDRGLLRIKDGQLSTFASSNGLASDAVLALYEDRKEQLWVGTASGLQRLVDGRLDPLELRGTLSGEAVDAIVEDRGGVLWVGTQDGGLNRIENGTVSSFTTRNGLSSDFVLSIYQDSYGTMWVGTAGGGLNRLRDGKLSAITTRQGLYDDSVFAILEDHAGNLWMSCNKGIFRVAIRELNAVADGITPRATSIPYGRGDGMKSRECNGGTQPVAWKTPDGKLWFATTRGVAMIDPVELREDRETPPIRIEQIYADRQSVPPQNAEIPPGTKTLEFHYTGLSFRAPEKVRFQYRLDGFDETWVDAGSRRVAYYTNLRPGSYRFQVRAKNGNGRWSEAPAMATLSLQPFFFQTRWFWLVSLLSVIGLAWTAHRSRVQLIRRSAERFKLLFDRNLAGVYRATIGGGILDCNDACARILGYSSRSELLIQNIADCYWSRSDFEQVLRRLREQGPVSNLETRLRRKDGEAVWVLKNVSLAPASKGEEILETTLIDITDRRRAEEQIRFQAYHDVLTELPNRTLFKDRLSLALAHAHRHGCQVAVLFLDLDRFKLINDTFGHTVGDHLLQGIASRLKTCVREEDSVARVGGDEFTLLLMDMKNPAEAATVARKILETVGRPITVDGNELYITTSIGISIYPADGEDAETLLKNADNALYRAKDAGRNNYQLCTPSMNRLAAERLSLENALRQALEREEFLVHYQPQFDLRTGEIIGVEALIRWDRPGKGLVLPQVFIPVAEESRLIIPIGDWVLQSACKQAKNWQMAKVPVRVAVNFSAAQFQQRHLAKRIQEALEHSALDPAYLEMEITESTAMQNPEHTAGILKDLKKLGISIVIDDFGVGHSSLNYLKRFPIDGLKIDRTFVQDITHDDSDAAIVSAVIAMARALKLRVIAEGVETPEQLKYLEEHGCVEFQGYLLSRPSSHEVLTDLLRGRGVGIRAQLGRRPGPAVFVARSTNH